MDYNSAIDCTEVPYVRLMISLSADDDPRAALNGLSETARGDAGVIFVGGQKEMSFDPTVSFCTLYLTVMYAVSYIYSTCPRTIMELAVKQSVSSIIPTVFVCRATVLGIMNSSRKWKTKK